MFNVLNRRWLSAAAFIAASGGCGEAGNGATTSSQIATPASPSASPTTSVTAPASASEVVAAMSPGWNLGNTLEAIGSGAKPRTSSQETVWGNPAASRALMDGIKAAGFKSVRIPVSWDQYADGSDTISPMWMQRVTQVVDDALAAGLYVVINVHWDGGWLQPTYAAQAGANAKLARFWEQIADNFKDHDERLFYAGTNEVMVTNVYSAPTAENCEVQKDFNQTFVDTVRATGGRNRARNLLVQAYNTNIDHALSCNAALPADSAVNRLLMEVHFYDPYDFTLNEQSSLWQWGAIATNPAVTPSWGGEAWVDAQFQKMKVNFVDKGIPVILGEYSAMLRSDLDPAGTYRTYWDGYVTRSAVRHGLVPMYWDAGSTANHGSGLFNRSGGSVAYPATVTAIVEAAQP